MQTDGQTHSYWMQSVAMPSFAALGANKRTDVCVVGAGIAGLCVAYFLAKAGIKVIIVESRTIGSGQTIRTTAHLTNALDDRFDEIERLLGLDAAAIAAESHQAAIEAYAKLVEELHIACEFERVDAYLFNGPQETLDVLKKDFETIQKIRMPGVTMEARAPLESFNTGTCIRFPNQAEFHPMKFIAGLVGALTQLGVEIYENTHVSNIEDGSPCIVKTRSGRQITAKDVVVTTNVPINDRFYMHTKQEAYRTYVIAGEVPKGSVTRGLYYDTEDPYHYIRVQSFDLRTDLLIVGGEDHKVGQDSHPDTKFNALDIWVKQRFPKYDKTVYRWSGQIIEPIDCLAFSGKNPGDEHVYIHTGDSGNGLTHGMIAGLLIPSLIQGKTHPWQHVYDPKRKTLAAAGDFVAANANVAMQYTDWITGGEVESDAQIPNGKGAIIRKGMKKYAAYRDDEGALHTVCATCPHLGCLVRWNDAEKTWDCPCHGSRFSPSGKVITGPATKGLCQD